MTYRENRFGSAPLVPVGDVPTSPLVFKSLWDANTIVKADTDNLPTALEIAEQRLVGRKLGGSIVALTKAEILSIINVTEGADVTGDNAPKVHKASHVDGSDDIRNATVSQKGLATAAQITKLGTIETNADVTDAANVNTAGAVMETDFGAQTLLRAILNNTPLALTVAEQRIVGRITGQNIAALTSAQVRTLINVANGADVTGSNAPQDHTHAAAGTQGGPLTLPEVNEAVALTAMATDLNLTDDIDFRYLLMKRGNIYDIPVNAGWYTTLTGTGNVSQMPQQIAAYTGATTLSSASFWTLPAAMGIVSFVSWNEDLYVCVYGFTIVHEDPTNQVTRFQFRQTNTFSAADMAERGIGIEVSGAGLALIAESHDGSTRSELDLSTALSKYTPYKLELIFLAGVGFAVYINDSQVGSTKTNNLPTGTGGDSRWGMSHIRGGGAAIDAWDRVSCGAIFLHSTYGE